VKENSGKEGIHGSSRRLGFRVSLVTLLILGEADGFSAKSPYVRKKG